jgi:hypothetical protein
MDPMSALSVATAVLQFVDFGSRLLSTSYEISRSSSGQTAKEVELSTITSELLGLVAHVKDTVEASKAGNRYRSEAENRLVKISEECEEVVSQFGSALDILKNRERTEASRGSKKDDGKSRISFLWGSPRAALASVWNASKIDGMIEQLEKLKRRMTAATLFCLW